MTFRTRFVDRYLKEITINVKSVADHTAYKPTTGSTEVKGVHMIREILSRFVRTTTTKSTGDTSTSLSTTSEDVPTPSYEDILEARRVVLKWTQQAQRITDLMESGELTLNQLAIDRRLAYDLHQSSRLATLDSDRLEEEAKLAKLEHLLHMLTGTKNRIKGEALTRHVIVALGVTYELESAWLKLKSLIDVAAEQNYSHGITKVDAAAKLEQSRKEFFLSVGTVVQHLQHTTPLTPETKNEA